MPPCPGSGTYVDLPDDLDIEKLADALTDLGLKLESVERPGDAISGPLVVGRVLTMDPEPQKNGKTINWCTVDVGGRQRHRRPPGHRLRRPQLRPRRPGRGGAARRRAARRLRDLGAQDLRPRVGRDDLLRRRARPRRGPRRHHRAPRRRRRARRGRPRRCSASTTRCMEFEINPDRAYALSMRGVAREAALASRTPASATRSSGTCRRPTTGAPGPRRGPDRLPGLRRPHRLRVRPDRADARLAGAPDQPRPGCARSRWRSTSPTT